MGEPLNESAISFAWLVERIEEAPAPGPQAQFLRLADTMRRDWRRGAADAAAIASDPWLCRSQVVESERVLAVWQPPDALDDFGPGLAPDDWPHHPAARPTRHASLDALLSNQIRFPWQHIVERCNRAIPRRPVRFSPGVGRRRVV